MASLANLPSDDDNDEFYRRPPHRRVISHWCSLSQEIISKVPFKFHNYTRTLRNHMAPAAAHLTRLCDPDRTTGINRHWMTTDRRTHEWRSLCGMSFWPLPELLFTSPPFVRSRPEKYVRMSTMRMVSLLPAVHSHSTKQFDRWWKSPNSPTNPASQFGGPHSSPSLP